MYEQQFVVETMQKFSEMPRKMISKEEIKGELLRLHAGCINYYEMFEPEKFERYSMRFKSSDEEVDKYGYSGIIHMEVSGVQLWIDEVGLPYLRSRGVI